jgi:hypothetical protein
MCRKGEHPLALSTKTTLVRSFDVFGSTAPAPFVAPLRIMVIMSNPKGTTPLNLTEEARQIKKSWGGRLNVQVDFVRPIQAEIGKMLREHQYHVIHFMGHGDYGADGVGVLMLEREDGSPHPVTGDDFALWLQEEPLLLVFLNACKSGTTVAQSAAHPFAGVATALIKAKVPAVVAMQFPISDAAAIIFAEIFYEGILRGLPVDAAVAEGRREVRFNDKTLSEWATPVLYLRSKDGMLFDWGRRDAAPRSGEPVSRPAAAGAAATAAAAITAEPVSADPWGPDAGDALRVFLANPDQNLLRRHRMLAEELKKLPGVRVVVAGPEVDFGQHAAVVADLVRRADLCVHLLGAQPGMRLDEDDGDPLRTFPLVELEIGRQSARSQLVMITSEDKESIADPAYAAKVDELAKIPRDKARFELVITDRNRIADAVKTKLDEMVRARQAQSAPAAADFGRQCAFVDAHVSDEERAVELVSYLEDRSINTGIRTSSAPVADFSQLDEAVRKSSLYIIVAGSVDRSWVSNRKIAILKSAMRTKAALLLAKYSAAPAEAPGTNVVTKSQFEINALKDCDSSWVERLFAPAPADKA